MSARELEVIEMLANDKTVKEVAAALMISLITAKSHVKNIYRKLNAHTRKE